MVWNIIVFLILVFRLVKTKVFPSVLLKVKKKIIIANIARSRVNVVFNGNVQHKRKNNEAKCIPIRNKYIYSITNTI